MSDCARVLGDVIKKAREKSGLSQYAAGRAIGVDNRTLLNIENYRGNPRFRNIYLIVRFFKIDPKVIFYPESQKESSALSRLQALIGDCSEREAAAIYPVVLSAIDMLRNSNADNVE